MSRDADLELLGREAEALAPGLATLAELDGPTDDGGAWNETLWQAVRSLGAPRWTIPTSLGGLELDRTTIVVRNALLAQSSLTAAFVLSQHDAATRRFLATIDRPVSRSWMDRLNAGEAFGTVGISQLTTSRRYGTAAMKARALDGGRYELDGTMPWVTGAERADVVVTGGLLEDGKQLLAALPTDRAGVSILPASPLAALDASRTTEIRLDRVVFEPDEILAGPLDDVMSGTSPVGTGGLETSALAMGQARAALLGLEKEAPNRPDLLDSLTSLRESWEELWSDLLDHTRSVPGAPTAAAIRARANALVLRLTQAYLTARRGSGFLKSEPAQRWARQALFFLVWSCPSPVASATVRDLVGICPT